MKHIPRRPPPDTDLAFRRELLDEAGIARTLRRMAHEIAERHPEGADLALVGIRTGGLVLAERLVGLLRSVEGAAVPLGAVDITLYRDDVFTGLPRPEVGSTELPFHLPGKSIVLVDDVLYTGRTVRAALDALNDYGRPRAVELAVLVDRGRRELPIQADYVGLKLTTSARESVRVMLRELGEPDQVVLREDGVTFAHRHLLGIEPLAAADIEQILDLAETFLEISERPIKKVPTLRGRTVINMFLEASTRTRTSFEIAAKRLSADAVNISGSSSSTVKGETLLDTARNLNAMRPDVIVLRHAASGGAAQIARHVDGAVVNAGDGAHEHPSQALLDCSTIRKHKGKVAGLEVAIVGDIAHSRVARSDIMAFSRLGARVRLCGPRTMMPVGIERLAEGTRVCHRLEEALEGADVVMMLRIQKERLGATPLFPNTREYSRTYGLSARTLAWAKPDAIVMHPGPINRGVELDAAIADGERSVILDQVTRGVAVRMAILYLLGGGRQGE